MTQTNAMQQNNEGFLLKEARRLVAIGLSVVPVKADGTKAVALTSWTPFQRERPTDAQLVQWFSAGRLGMAVVNGAISGNLETLDFDEPGLYDAWAALMDAEGLGDVLATLPVVLTPSGGHKVFWRSALPAPRTEYLAYRPVDGDPKRREIRIETQGEGKSSLVPPSGPDCHPLGIGYTYLQNHLAGVPTITAGQRDEMLEMARTFNLWAPPVPVAPPLPKRAQERAEGVLRPGDDFNQRGEWGPLLRGAGLECKRTAGSVSYWGWADTNDKSTCCSVGVGGNQLYNFSSNAYPLEPGQSYSLFGAYATLKHGGDYGAAATALAADGYGTPSAPSTRPRSPRASRTRAEQSDAPAEDHRVHAANHALADSLPWVTAPPEEAAEEPSAEEVPEGEPLDGPEPDAPPPSDGPRVLGAGKGKQPPSMLDLASDWAKEHRDRYLFVEGAQWWRYEDGMWSYSSVERVQASVQKYLTRRHDADKRVSVSPTNVRGMLFLAQSLLGPVPLTVFDSNPSWVALQNGVYDTATHTLLEHSPTNRLTHQSPYLFDPAAECPRWTRFLRQVMLRTDGEVAEEWIGLLQEWFGYCLLPDTSAQASMFWVGDGGNGKGTAGRVLENLVGGDFCRAIPIEQLHDPYYRADLYGKLVGFVDEPDPRAMQKNGNFFKRLVGGDIMDARRPTEKVFNFRPTARMVVSCNALPPTRDLSHGYFRRILLLEWRYKVPANAREKDLDESLAAEMSGIFNWAMLGLARWRDRGRKLEVPEECERLVAEYRMSEDTVGRFLSEEVVEDPFASVSNKALYAAYETWCKENGEKNLSSSPFGKEIAKKGYKVSPRKDAAGRSVRYWFGLNLPGTIKEMDYA